MNALKKPMTQKIICIVVALVLTVISGYSFYEQRHYKETVVVSDALTEVQWLSDYVPELKGTFGDTPIFVFDSGVEGGSALICGGTHPYEPATSIAAYVLMENIQVEKVRFLLSRSQAILLQRLEYRVTHTRQPLA